MNMGKMDKGKMNKGKIIIVGLGPGDDRYVTAHTVSVIESVPNRFVRTRHHPSAHLVPEAQSFDHLYEQADSFDEVYREIASHLLAQTDQGDDLVYAVPGSPLILERTVALLRSEHPDRCVIHPAMSFLDLLYARLGIDPVETGVKLVDGHQFAVAAAGYTGPMIVAHTHADWVLSEIKLAAEEADGSEPVAICQRLGTAQEQIVWTTWEDLDRSVTADHLTSLWIPGLGTPVGAEYLRFHELTRTLREQCPWDIEQTHQSLIPHLIEETYEVVDAIGGLNSDDPATDEHLIEELGDLLYQIEFHARIAEEQGRFTIADVARGIHDKLVRRHPHVFPPEPHSLAGGESVGTENLLHNPTDSAGVLANWEEIKKLEKGRTSIFEGIPAGLPALAYARKLQSKASKMGFDWPDRHGPLAKIAEETAEVEAAVSAGDSEGVTDELGDLLFSVVNLARHLDVEPESALRSAANRFRERASIVEQLAAETGINLATAPLATLEELWETAKLKGSGS
jgi:tetrapyrrole methylase family protein / MazG family protein